MSARRRGAGERGRSAHPAAAGIRWLRRAEAQGPGRGPAGSAQGQAAAAPRRGGADFSPRGLEPGGRIAVDGAALAAEDEPTEAQPGEEDASSPICRPPPAVLGQEPEVALDLLPEERRGLRPPARAADVHRLGIGIEQRLPPGLAQAVAPVGLLAEEEELLVERPDLLERSPPEEECGCLG